MLILGIETSCDETAAAVVKDGREILSNVVASSVELHKKSGGIIPEVAAREQAKCIIPVINESIKGLSLKTPRKCPDLSTSSRSPQVKSRGKRSRMDSCEVEKKEKTNSIYVNSIKSLKGIDAIAVTVGPGLIGSLLVGVEAAKTLAFVLKKPIIPVNHLLAHFYAAWLKPRVLSSKFLVPSFPLVGLIASGGHTDLILMKSHGNYIWLGGTRDDAAGECFDKTARLLGLGYPGGPAIEAAASTISHKSLIINHLPRPMINQDNFDFSFSGLKTAVLQKVKKEIPKVSKAPEASKVSKALAREIQEAITDVLVEKTIRAAKKHQVKGIIVAGGVAANKRLKEKFQSSIINHQSSIKLFVPPARLCTDNAAAIASCAFYNFKPISWQKIQANPSLSL